jgi:hypothetical protein
MKRIIKRTGLLAVLASLALFIFSCGSSTQVHVSNKGRTHQGVNYDVRYNSHQGNPQRNYKNMNKHHKRTPPPKPHKHHKRHR